MFLNITTNYYLNTESILSLEYTGSIIKINTIYNRYFIIKKDSSYFDKIISKLGLENIPHHNP
mgnify:CR=1 FL=1|jgi:hypothetical protein